MSAKRHELAGASAVSEHDWRHYAQGVEWPNGLGCWVQVGSGVTLALEWGEARAVRDVLSALLEDEEVDDG